VMGHFFLLRRFHENRLFGVHIKDIWILFF